MIIAKHWSNRFAGFLLLLSLFIVIGTQETVTLAATDEQLMQTIEDYFSSRYRSLETLAVDAAFTSFFAEPTPHSLPYFRESDRFIVYLHYLSQLNVDQRVLPSWDVQLEYLSMVSDSTGVKLILREIYSYEIAGDSENLRNGEIIHQFTLHDAGDYWSIVSHIDYDTQRVLKEINTLYNECHGDLPRLYELVKYMATYDNNITARKAQLASTSSARFGKLMGFFGQHGFWHGNSYIQWDVEQPLYPILLKGEEFLPVRALTEALGAQVEWSVLNREVQVTYGSSLMKFQIFGYAVDINGYETECRPLLVGNRVFLPAQLIARFLNHSYYADASCFLFNPNNESADIALQEFQQGIFLNYNFTELPKISIADTVDHSLIANLSDCLSLDGIELDNLWSNFLSSTSYDALLTNESDFIIAPLPNDEERIALNSLRFDVEYLPLGNDLFLIKPKIDDPFGVHEYFSKYLQVALQEEGGY